MRNHRYAKLIIMSLIAAMALSAPVSAATRARSAALSAQFASSGAAQLCASAIVASTATVATSQVTPGCVLPVADPAAPVVANSAPLTTAVRSKFPLLDVLAWLGVGVALASLVGWDNDKAVSRG